MLVHTRLIVTAVLAVGAAIIGPSPVSAQPLGVFSWRLEPFCNVVTLHVIQRVTPPGAVYAITGFDDQCGSSDRATVTGTATFNHDGSIGVGLTIVTRPGGTPVYVDARVNRASMSGPWTDSAGSAGRFVVVTPSTDARRVGLALAAAGSPRPVPSSGVAPGSIASAQLAPGAIGATQLAPRAVGGGQIDPLQVQARISEACPSGTRLRQIHADGTVACEPQAMGPVSAYELGFSRTLPASDLVVQSLSLVVPSAGTVLVQASGDLFLLRIAPVAEVMVGTRCSISLGTSVEQDYMAEAVLTLSTIDFPIGHGKTVRLALIRGFDVSPGTFTVNLVCMRTLNGSSAVVKPSLTALFVPSS